MPDSKLTCCFTQIGHVLLHRLGDNVSNYLDCHGNCYYIILQTPRIRQIAVKTLQQLTKLPLIKVNL